MLIECVNMNDEMINKGTYCIVINMIKNWRVKIVAKGFINFQKGYYVYVGSALNSLTKRIERHLSDDKKKRWHADYLLLNKNAEVKEVVYTHCDKKIECDISHKINENADEYIEGFGCSDCNCVSHLYYFKEYDNALNSSIKAYEKTNYEANFWFN